MPKNPKITDEAKILIQQFHKRHPRWKAKDIQIRVSQVLHSRNPGLPPGWPSLSSVQKAVAKIKNRDLDSPIDEQWSLGSLSEYPIPIDALPMVMSIWERRLMQGDADEFLTIREALWVARLYKLIELYKPRHIPPDVRDALSDYYIKEHEEPNSWTVSELASEITVEDLVDDYASVYAGYEMLSETEGEPFNSSELDIHIYSNVYEYWGERRGNEIEGICADYGLDRPDYYKLLTLNLPISEIEEIVKSGKYRSTKKEVQNERPHS